MNDQYGNGRWGTGSRPVGTGPAQSAWDQGHQARRNAEEQQRRMRQQQDEAHRRNLENQRKQEEERRRNQSASHQSTTSTAPLASSATPVDGDDGSTGNGLLLLAGIGGFVFLLVAVWNILLGTFPTVGGPIGTALKFSPWIVGIAGIAIGIRIQEFLMQIAAWLILAAVLFFGAAIIVGLYQGMTN